MRRTVSIASACLAVLACVSCGDESSSSSHDASSSLTIASTGARVTFDLQHFAMTIATPAGRAVLATSADPPSPDDPLRAFGAVGATHRETALRPSIIEGYDHATPTDDPWLHASAVDAVSSTPSSATIDLHDPSAPDVTMTLHVEVDGTEVRVTTMLADHRTDAAMRPLNLTGVSFTLGSDEKFVGLGEREAGVQHRGRHYQCWTEEGGIGGGENAPPGPGNPAPNGPGMTHIPIPFLMSSRGFGLWIDTTFRTGFDLGADDPSRWRFYAEEPQLAFTVFVHDDPKDTLAAYTAHTGHAELPAPWVFGPRRRVDIGSQVDGVPEELALRQRGVPTTMIDDTTHFLPNGSQLGREADLAAWTAHLHGLGFKAIGYFNGHVSTTIAQAAPILAEARAINALVRLDNGAEFDTSMISGGAQRVATVDFTNPDALAWYQGKLQGALDLGYDGWMLDFGEYLPQHALLHDGLTGWEGHNRYPLLLQHANYDYLKRVRGNDFMIFTRSGAAGTQATTSLAWSGDPSASFDDARGLPAQVRSGIGAGLSGIPFWGSDISGFSCVNDPPADKEVYLRWAEFGALSSDMHDENACSAKKADAPPKWTLWSDAETTAVYGQYAQLHTRLFPYTYAAAREATETGLPVIRHPLLMDPGDPPAWDAVHEYWYGPSLFVAPVVRRGARTRELYLPRGTWFDWWTDAAVDGGADITRDAPLDTLPLYQRAGSLVPLLSPDVQTLATTSDPSVIDMLDRADVLDARAALATNAPRARIALVDGTTLEASLGGVGIALPADVPVAANDDALASCDRCGTIDTTTDGTRRVRVTATGDLDLGGLVLHSARPSSPLRTRWYVVVR